MGRAGTQRFRAPVWHGRQNATQSYLSVLLLALFSFSMVDCFTDTTIVCVFEIKIRKLWCRYRAVRLSRCG